MQNIEWMSLISSIVGAILGTLAVNWYLRKYNYDHLFAENVSKSRMQWIDNFREEFSIFIGYVLTLRNIYCKHEIAADKNLPEDSGNKNCCGNKDCNDRVSQLMAEAEKARAKLRTRLNMDITRKGNEHNLMFDDALCSIDLGNLSGTKREHIEYLMVLSRKILEHEWQRVKREAKGEK